MGHTVIGLYYRRDKRVTIRSRLLSAITGYHSGTSQSPHRRPVSVDTGKQESVNLNGRVEISAVDIFCLLVLSDDFSGHQIRGPGSYRFEINLSPSRITLFLDSRAISGQKHVWSLIRMTFNISHLYLSVRLCGPDKNWRQNTITSCRSPPTSSPSPIYACGA